MTLDPFCKFYSYWPTLTPSIPSLPLPPTKLYFVGKLPKTYHASVILSVNPQSIHRDKDFAHTHLMPDPLEANLSHFGITACCPLAQTLHRACCTPVKYLHRITAEGDPPTPPHHPLLPAAPVINAQMWLARHRARTPDLTARG